MQISYIVSEVEELPLLSLLTAAGFDVELVLIAGVQPEMLPESYAHLPTSSLFNCQHEQIQIALATNWHCALELFRLPAKRHVVFLERLWHEQLSEDDPGYVIAKSSLQLPVHFLTTSQYVLQVLQQLCPENSYAFFDRPRLLGEVEDFSTQLALELTASPQNIYSHLENGRPVITFATPETEQIIDHGVNGLLLGGANPEELERLYETTEHDTQLKKTLFSGAQATAQAMPTVAHTAATLQAIFSKILTQAPEGSSSWLGDLLATVYQQAVVLHELCEARREELHNAQRRQNDSKAELFKIKRTLETDRLYRIAQKVRRRP